MDKVVVFAVAGAGKTSLIVNSIKLDSKVLILTYTTNNVQNIKNKIIKKFGSIPKGVKIYGYFSFLYTFCYKPILQVEVKARGLAWITPKPWTKKVSHEHYFTSNNYIYANRLAKLIIACAIKEVIERMEKYFDCFYIDEVQDIAGNDFSLITELAKANMNQILVGDFYQHTFDTSRDGNVNSGLHKDYDKYISRLVKSGYQVDKSSLSASYRCSPTICDFISSKLKIDIDSHHSNSTYIKFLDNESEILQIINNKEIIKLFYQASDRYNCDSANWGAVKGLDDFQDVCVVLNNKTLKHYNDGTLHTLAQSTLNKLYVACSRARGNLYFISEKSIKNFKTD